MKKSLLLVSAAFFAMAANAQVAVFATQENQDALGLNTKGADDKVVGKLLTDEEVAATPLVTSEVGDLYLAFGDTWKAGSAYDKYSKVKINGGDEEYALGKYGAVGSTNPTFVSYQDGAQTAGAVFRVDSKAEGWITVFTKLAANKQFVVMEGKTGPLPYRLGYANATAVFTYQQPTITDENSDDFGYINFSDNPTLENGEGKYFIAATTQAKNEEGVPLWTDAEGNQVAQADKPEGGKAVMVDIEPRQDKPQFPYLTAGLESNPGNATVFVSFNVLEGNSYYVSALGSKVPVAGFIYTENEPTITYCATDELPEITFAPGQDPVAGVESISAALSADAPIYNMMGVRVNADAKGILIQNGKKFIRK